MWKKEILSREHHSTCYNSSLVLSRLDPALVKAAYNIACPQLNGDTLIFLYAVLWMLERVWTRLPRFSAHAKATQHKISLFR